MNCSENIRVKPILLIIMLLLLILSTSTFAQTVTFRFDPPDSLSGFLIRVDSTAMTVSRNDVSVMIDTVKAKLDIVKTDSSILKTNTFISGESYVDGEKAFISQYDIVANMSFTYEIGFDGIVDTIYDNERIGEILRNQMSANLPQIFSEHEDFFGNQPLKFYDWNYCIQDFANKSIKIGKSWDVYDTLFVDNTYDILELNVSIDSMKRDDLGHRVFVKYTYAFTRDKSLSKWEDIFFQMSGKSMEEKGDFTLHRYDTYGFIEYIIDPVTLLMYQQINEESSYINITGIGCDSTIIKRKYMGKMLIEYNDH